MEDLIYIFEKSFEQKQFTGSDRKAVKEYLSRYKLEKREKDFIRSRLFDMAKMQVTDDQLMTVIDWLENANKSLHGKPDKTADNSVFFSPGEECVSAIINRITFASSSIKVCVFTISDDRIAEALLKAHQIGISVKIITDNDKCFDEGSDIERMWREGIPCKIDNSPNHMHHKFVVMDHRIALTGSYNWTRSAANHNFENLLVTDVNNVVSAYEREFDRLWDEMEDYSC